MTEMTGRVEILQRIAAFSAQIRGHQLGEWRTGEGVMLVNCVRCRAELRVYHSVIQPEMDGAALDTHCGQKEAAHRAA